MKFLIGLILLLVPPVYAADFADTDQMYFWDPATSTRYYPTFLSTKTAIFTDLGTDCTTAGVVGCALVWESDGEGGAAIPVSVVSIVDTDPTALTAEEGALTLSTASGDLFYKSAAGFFVIPGTYTAD